MITATKNWRRWCGPRQDLARALELAAQELEQWTGAPSVTDVRVEDDEGFTETGPYESVLATRHPSELAHLRSVVATVAPDLHRWRNKVAEDRALAYEKQEPYDAPSQPSAEVEVRITNYGAKLSVQGDDRTRVQGLTTRVIDALGRSATNSPGVDRFLIAMLGILLSLGAFFLGVAVARWTGLIGPAPNDRLEVGELLSGLGGLIVSASLAAALWWMFPTVEMLDEAGVGRARRFRTWIVAVVAALVIALIGSLIYDQMS